MTDEPKTPQEPEAAGSACSARLSARMTFEDFLEERGFHADACEATTHPDFYALTEQLWRGLNRIEEHWDGEDGEIDPVFMAHTAKDALMGIG